MGYTAGRANSSFFVKAGQMHMQEGEGTRAAMFYNLFPEPAPLLTNTSPVNFSLDQHPVGVNVGYTWASNYFKQVFAVSAKVTNGLNADGSEILFNSTKNSKDYWFDADYWFGPDGGVTFMTYYGTKDQVQNQGADDEFTFRPTIRRYGVFGNYLFFDKLDVLGGYLRSSDDWQDEAGGKTTRFTSNGYRAEVGLLHPARLRSHGQVRPHEAEYRRRAGDPYRGLEHRQRESAHGNGQRRGARHLRPRARSGPGFGLGGYRQALQNRSAVDVVKE